MRHPNIPRPLSGNLPFPLFPLGKCRRCAGTGRRERFTDPLRQFDR